MENRHIFILEHLFEEKAKEVKEHPYDKKVTRLYDSITLALTTEEDIEFRQWARDNYKPHSPIKGTWHPSIQFECALINATTKVKTDDIPASN